MHNLLNKNKRPFKVCLILYLILNCIVDEKIKIIENMNHFQKFWISLKFNGYRAVTTGGPGDIYNIELFNSQ